MFSSVSACFGAYSKPSTLKNPYMIRRIYRPFDFLWTLEILFESHGHFAKELTALSEMDDLLCMSSGKIASSSPPLESGPDK